MSNGSKATFPMVQGTAVFETGLTKREYFAALAIQSLITPAAIMENGERFHERYAVKAVQMADALLKALES